MSKAIRDQLFNADASVDILHAPQEKTEGKHKFPFYMRPNLRETLSEMSYRERLSIQKIIENALDMYLVHKGLPRLAELDPDAAPKPKKRKTA